MPDHATLLGELSNQGGKIFRAGEREGRGLQHQRFLFISYDSIYRDRELKSSTKFGLEPFIFSTLFGFLFLFTAAGHIRLVLQILKHPDQRIQLGVSLSEPSVAERSRKPKIQHIHGERQLINYQAIHISSLSRVLKQVHISSPFHHY
jgi:hypothetical protein